MVGRLLNLDLDLQYVLTLDFRSNRAEGDDLLGDADEYVIRHFATKSGKSKRDVYIHGTCRCDDCDLRFLIGNNPSFTLQEPEWPNRRGQDRAQGKL